jgi:hypothetical protein
MILKPKPKIVAYIGNVWNYGHFSEWNIKSSRVCTLLKHS